MHLTPCYMKPLSSFAGARATFELCNRMLLSFLVLSALVRHERGESNIPSCGAVTNRNDYQTYGAPKLCVSSLDARRLNALQVELDITDEVWLPCHVPTICGVLYISNPARYLRAELVFCGGLSRSGKTALPGV